MNALLEKRLKRIGALMTCLGAAMLIFLIVMRILGVELGFRVDWKCAVLVFGLLIPGAVLAFRERYAKLEFSKKTGLWGVIFLAPWLIGFLLFFLVPMARAVIFSFQDVSINTGVGGGMIQSFVGWDNFTYILTQHATFTQSMVETVLEVVLYTVLVIVFSLLCAILLNGRFVGRSIARAIFFIPIVMATGLMVQRVTGVTSMMMAQSQEENVYGAQMVSRLLYSLGIGKSLVDMLNTAVNDIFEVVSLSGIQILIFLSALQGIPPQLYEVAKIEGATGYETFWKVTVVMVSPMILTCTLYTISDLFLRSDIADTFRDVAFGAGKYGLSASMSVFFLAVVLVVIMLFILPLRKVVFYYD